MSDFIRGTSSKGFTVRPVGGEGPSYGSAISYDGRMRNELNRGEFAPPVQEYIKHKLGANILNEVKKASRLSFYAGGKLVEGRLTQGAYNAITKALPFSDGQTTILRDFDSILSDSLGNDDWESAISEEEYTELVRVVLGKYWVLRDLIEHRDISLARSSMGIRRFGQS